MTLILQKKFPFSEAFGKLTLKEAYPFEWIPLSKEERMCRRQVYFAQGPWCVSPNASMLNLVRSRPGNVLMPHKFVNFADRIYNFKVRPDDVFVVTFPKCGTTWMQELVWQILHDFDPLVEEPLTTRSPFLEMESLTSEKPSKMDYKAVKALETAEAMTGPRVIKTHLPLEMLPPNLLQVAKVVFVARNPMDCCVSFFHHEKQVPNQGFSGSFQQYAELFRQGNNPMGNYFYHLMSGWKRRKHPNLNFVWYEDMKKDLPRVITDMETFLGKSLVTEEKRQALRAHLHIDTFRKNDSVNMLESYQGGTFIRKGSVGGWKNHFDEETLKEWKKWVEQNTKGTGINFDMEV